MKNKILASLILRTLNSDIVVNRTKGVEQQKHLFDVLNKQIISDKKNVKYKLCLGKYDEWDQLELITKDNTKISAMKWINPNKTNKWVVGLHGYRSKKEIAGTSISFFKELGYNLFTFDSRGHGMSQEKLITYGVNEQFDLLSALDYLNQNYNVEELILIGFSMGAITINLFSLSPESTKYNIKHGISDSAPYDLKKSLENLSSQFLKIDISPENIEEFYIELQSLTGINETSYNVKNITWDHKLFPIMYVTSFKDRIVPWDSAKLFIDQRKNIKDGLYIFEETDHIKACYLETDKYVENVLDYQSKV